MTVSKHVMPEPDGFRSRKSQRFGHVTLTSGFHESSQIESCVVVGDRIRPEASMQSHLLSGIGGTDGVAALPGDISAEDVQLWQAASIVGYEPSAEELVTVLKVADAVGDSNMATWTSMLTERALAMHAQQGTPNAEATHCALLSLPPHLLHDVLGSCIDRMNLRPLLAMLPADLHPDIIAAAILLEDGQLTLCLHHPIQLYPYLSDDDEVEQWEAPERVLAMLAAARPLRPLDFLTFGHGSDQLLRPATSAAHLARALGAHSTLFSLTLNCTFLSAAWLHRLRPGLAHAALPELEVLHIAISAADGGCAALARCLQRLPALCILRVDLQMDNQAPTAPRPSLLSTFARSTACPAALTRLTELEIKETQNPAAYQQRQDYPRRTSSRVLQLLPLLHAPQLAHLTIDAATGDISRSALLRCLTQMPELVTLSMTGELRDSFTSAPTISCYPPPDSNAAPAPQEIPIDHLHIYSSCPLSALTLATTVVSRASLFTLHLRGLACHSQPLGEEVVRAWTQLLRAVACCDCLEELQLNMLCGFPDASCANAFTSELAGAMQKLPALTQLSLGVRHRPQRSEYSVLCAEGLAAGLRRLTGLRSLYLCSEELQLAPHAQGVVDACASLQQLTELALCCSGVTPQLVAGLVPRLPALARLRVDERMFDVPASGDAPGDSDALRAMFPAVHIIV